MYYIANDDSDDSDTHEDDDEDTNDRAFSSLPERDVVNLYLGGGDLNAIEDLSTTADNNT